MKDVISQIEAAMERQHVSRAELAQRIGHAHASGISRLLSRQHEPGDKLLQAIATALQVELTVPARPARRYQPTVATV